MTNTRRRGVRRARGSPHRDGRPLPLRPPGTANTCSLRGPSRTSLAVPAELSPRMVEARPHGPHRNPEHPGDLVAAESLDLREDNHDALGVREALQALLDVEHVNPRRHPGGRRSRMDTEKGARKAPEGPTPLLNEPHGDAEQPGTSAGRSIVVGRGHPDGANEGRLDDVLGVARAYRTGGEAKKSLNVSIIDLADRADVAVGHAPERLRVGRGSSDRDDVASVVLPPGPPARRRPFHGPAHANPTPRPALQAGSGGSPGSRRQLRGRGFGETAASGTIDVRDRP